MKNYGIILLLFFTLFTNNNMAEGRVDSLTNLLVSVDDTSRVDIYYKLFWEYISRDLIEAERVAIKMLELAEKANYETGIGISYDALLNLSLQQSDFEKTKNTFIYKRKIMTSRYTNLQSLLLINRWGRFIITKQIMILPYIIF